MKAVIGISTPWRVMLALLVAFEMRLIALRFHGLALWTHAIIAKARRMAAVDANTQDDLFVAEHHASSAVCALATAGADGVLTVAEAAQVRREIEALGGKVREAREQMRTGEVQP